ncbi:MAG: cobalamin-dependent protein [Pseudomonadota bacterium]
MIETSKPLDRETLLPEPDLPTGPALLAEGGSAARDWTVGPCPFLTENDIASEADYKAAAIAEGRIMRHAQIGFRDPDKNRRAYRDVYEDCRQQGVGVDRYGLCLDWAMGYPLDLRRKGPRGTGVMLKGPEAFAALTHMAPVAPHFGDFVLGFPGAFDNTKWALAAGSTAIGNLGQWFTFRLPHWDDDVASACSTVRALGLMSAQPVPVLVHSNLDDGFAASFSDLTSALGFALLERHIVETLVGGRMAHCYGHHFSEGRGRLAFLLALAGLSEGPGTMIYGNTTSYRGAPAANYASLSAYLEIDIAGQRLRATGHAINPVPVSENERIPDIDEIVDAQLFADRLINLTEDRLPPVDLSAVEADARQLCDGAVAFRDRVLVGLTEAGVDTGDVLEMLLVLRRIGARRLERLFGDGEPDADLPAGFRPRVASPVYDEIARMAESRLARIDEPARSAIADAGLKVLTATTDVHEHGKTLLDTVMHGLTITVEDGGISVDPDDLAEQAASGGADLICISTYNGVALGFLEELVGELAARGVDVPVLVGGRLNQIPSGSNTSLPVDVAAELEAAGAHVCRDIDDAIPLLTALARASAPKSP